MFSKVPKYMGRVQKGDRLSILIPTLDANNQGLTASAAPTMTVERLGDSDNAAAVVVAAAKVPLAPNMTNTFMFKGVIEITDSFSAGLHAAVFKWTDSATRYAIAIFDVADGGDSRGTITSMFSWEQHNGWHLLAATDNNHLAFGRNPK